MPPRRRNQAPPPPEEPADADRRQANPMQAFVDLLMGAFQNRNQNTALVQPPAIPFATFKDFKDVGPPEFKGTTDPIEAQLWVKEIEKAFIVSRVAEEQKTAFATYMLKGEANYWWEANQDRAGEGIATWAKFKELFLENYFPKSMQAKMEVRFLELKQEDMSVAEYATKFNELARFAPHQVDTEERKARRFEQGLKPTIYSKIAVFQLESFAAILDKAIIAEEGSRAETKYYQEQKRKWNSGSSTESNFGGNKRRGNDRNKNSRSMPKEGQVKLEQCSKCGNSHVGECLKGVNRCYRCGQEGHIVPNCPNPRKNYGCFTCGDKNHHYKDCPKKGHTEGNGNKSNNSKLVIGESVQPNRPMSRAFNMMVLRDAQNKASGKLFD